MDDKGEEKMGKAANSSISLKQIHVTDNFWNKYVHLVKDVIIPYQWDILNDKLEDVERICIFKSTETFDQLRKNKLVKEDALLFINSIASVS